MIRRVSVLFLIILTLSFIQCAKRGNPSGGPLDTIPPKFVRAAPENFTTNFDQEEIRIYFNEYIVLQKPQEQIIISPPMSPRPEISPLGTPRRDIRVKISDTLEENTTYVINFGRSIVDNNEKNPLPFFKYVFSTGSYIDSLSLSGTLSDALLKEPETFISVMLYEMDENFTDSIPYNQPPRYITNTLDSLTSFELTNLKEGNYHLVAIKDVNNNYLYNPGREKIGFIDGPVSVPSEEGFNLVMFRENLPFQTDRSKQLAQQKLLVGHRGKINPDSLQFNLLNEAPQDFEYRITKVPDKDSIHFWYKPVVETDSLRLEVVSPIRRDTLLSRITDMPRDSLTVTTAPSGNIDILRNFVVSANTPLVGSNEELIYIINRDSVNVPFTAQLRPFENTLQLSFDKNENQTYHITLLPGAVTDFFNSTNDTIKKSLNTKAFSEYGNITLNLQNVKSFPIIVQLTDEKGVVKAERISTSQTNIRFDFLTPGKFLARVVYDRNGNGVWDTGDYPRRIQPEEIIYFPEVLDIRPNWDVNQPFSVN